MDDYRYRLQAHLKKFYNLDNNLKWDSTEYYQPFKELINGLKISTILDIKNYIKDLSIQSHDLKKSIKDEQRNKASLVSLGRYYDVCYVLRHLHLAYGYLKHIPRNKLEPKCNPNRHEYLFYHYFKDQSIPNDVKESLKYSINEAFVKELTDSVLAGEPNAK